MIYASIAEVVGRTPVVHLSRLFSGSPVEVLAKLEFLNPLGSAKDRVARYVIEESLRQGVLEPGGRIVESSSGNLGIALAALGPLYGLAVTCVVDPVISPANLVILRNLGAHVEMVEEPDRERGYLQTRLRRVHELLRDQPDLLWVNQYANELCLRAHADGTAEELLADVDGRLDVLAVAVSTTATLLGAGGRLRQRWPDLRLVAVDALGSAVFGGPGAPRRLPGLGSSRQPELLQRAGPDLTPEVRYVSEDEAISGCRDLLRSEGILAGASSGAVVAALRGLIPELAPGTRIATVLPDRGERYLGLVYADPAPLAEVAKA